MTTLTIAPSGTTVAEIAANSLAAVRVFEKYGIDYCCGGKRPLDEACRLKGISSTLLRDELAAALETATTPETDWTQAPLGQLIDHIVDTHHAYLRRELPAIQARLDKVYRVYNQRFGPTLIGLPEAFAELRAELEPHLVKEEAILFPAIRALDGAQRSSAIGNPIQVMEAEHEHAGRALESIRAITNGYSVPDHACNTYRALIIGLADLEKDLHLHIHLENNVLFPRAMAVS